MKHLLHVAIAICLLSSCGSDTNDNTTNTNDIVNETVQEVAETTAEKGNAGSGNATAKIGDQEIKIEGVCGAVTTMGSLTIAINDKTQNSNAMIINFSGTELPTATKTYKVMDHSENLKEDEVSVSFVNFKDNGMKSWDSDNSAGTLTIEVNSNELKSTFSNIKLQPAQMYNKPPFDKVATVEGQFLLTK